MEKINWILTFGTHAQVIILTLTNSKVSVKQMMQHLMYSKMNNSHLDEWITFFGH